MSFSDDVKRNLSALEAIVQSETEALRRFRAEIEFAVQLSQAGSERQAEWERLIIQAVTNVKDNIAAGVNTEQAVAQSESLLSPIGKKAKEYTIHCIGHAHIDMNWMWDWPETVATTNDTFTTVDRLMEEFPEFQFSQSQASVYQITKDYLPELYERIKQRVAEGRWEITANQWVEGSKNLASGEILCRHLLYTKRFFKDEFGLSYDAVKINWEPDTFGHTHTLPTILNQAGVRRYYFHRGSAGPHLFWWQGKDGSRVLAFDDRIRAYNGQIGPHIIGGLLEFEQATGLKDYIFVFGVGDHGGGPMRRDLMEAQKLSGWPIFPNVKLSTTDAFYSVAEKAKNLPVIDAELNFVFEGCYTTQTSIKFANRKSENALVEAEAVALLGKGIADIPYPSEALFTGWRHAMFSQFHDILPGSGVRATREYTSGLFQEIMAQTTMIKTRALRKIAGMVNTNASCILQASCATEEVKVGPGIGAGPGDVPAAGAISRRSGDAPCCDPFVIFNPNPWKRTEVITARLWDRDWSGGGVLVKDDSGNTYPGQILTRGVDNFWGHSFIDVAFPVQEVEGLGYRSYSLAASVVPTASGPCSGDGKGVIENEYLRVEIESCSGAIIHLVDKQSNLDFVPEGGRLGLLEYLMETPHPMSAWVLGQIVETRALTEGARIEYLHNGPYLASVRATHHLKDSTLNMTISLSAGMPRVDFLLEVDWLERGSPEIGVPMLKVAFPLAIKDTVATFECANGHVERPTDPEEFNSLTKNLSGLYFPGTSGVDMNPAEVPAQKWADLEGKHVTANKAAGAVLVNDSKYGHRVDHNTIRLTLIRSAYEPDTLPEIGKHLIRFAIRPHVGEWTVSDSTREGYSFNFPLNIVSTTQQAGTLPARKGFAELLTPNVMLSGMKKAEDSEALVIRLYEMEGKASTAQLKLDEVLAQPNAPAVEADLLEQPQKKSTAKMKNGVLSVEIPAFGLVTVKIG